MTSRNDRIDDTTTLDIVERFETYEDYLDSQLTSNDMSYLEDEEMARQLVELGYRGLGDTIRREDFEARKKLLLERSTQKHIVPRKLASLDKDLSASAFLQALAEREESLRNGKLTTILFIRDKNNKV
jgi:BMFP domain-containing protein YqiC